MCLLSADISTIPYWDPKLSIRVEQGTG
jgi:hypothetical protein